MQSIFENYKTTGYLHHAFVLTGGESVARALAGCIADHLHIEIASNPDVSVVHYESFGIDEARGLAEGQTRAGFAGARKIFIISTPSFTREAQNALLKTFEEPTEGTHFFIIIPHADMLLPTLRSRVVLVEQEEEREGDEQKLAEKFLESSLAERFALAKKIGEMHDREKTRRILNHMEHLLHTRAQGTPEMFHDLYTAKTYLGDRGSSPKMLLEHLAIAFSR